MRKIDTIFKKFIVYEGLQHGGKQKSGALLVADLEIWWRQSLKISKFRHFETNLNIRKLPRQIYIKLLKVSFKEFNWKNSAMEFHTHHLKDLSSMLITIVFADIFICVKEILYFLSSFFVKVWPNLWIVKSTKNSYNINKPTVKNWGNIRIA